MTKLVYDDSKDLYEGLIIEIDNGNQNQVAQMFPNFRQKYGKLFAAAPDMAEALKLYISHHAGTRGHYCSECHNEIEKAFAKAEGK